MNDQNAIACVVESSKFLMGFPDVETKHRERCRERGTSVFE